MAGEITINCGAMRAAGIPYEGQGFSQAFANATWKAIGYPLPAPLVPQSMVGRKLIPTKSGPYLSGPGGERSMKKGARHLNKEERKFLNFWGKAIDDPCHKQSGISKIAGGILQVASVVFAPLAIMQTIADVGNASLAAGRANRDMRDATEIMTKAAQAPVAKINAVPTPPLIAPVSQLVPQPAGLVSRDRVSQVTQKPRSRWTQRDWAIAGGAGLVFYLLVRSIKR